MISEILIGFLCCCFSAIKMTFQVRDLKMTVDIKSISGALVKHLSWKKITSQGPVLIVPFVFKTDYRNEQTVAKRWAFIVALKEEICNILCVHLWCSTLGGVVAAAHPQRSAANQTVEVAACCLPSQIWRFDFSTGGRFVFSAVILWRTYLHH